MSNSSSGANGQQPGYRNTRSLLAEIVFTPLVAKPKPTMQSAAPLANIPRNSNGMIIPAPPHVVRTQSNSPDIPVETVLARQIQEDELRELHRSKRVKMNDPPTVAPCPKVPTYGMSKIPETFVQARPEDKMLWTWKLDDRGWVKISTKWMEMTGYRYPGEDGIWNYAKEVRTLIEQLTARWHKLKQSFAASGTLPLPEWWYDKYPVDFKYKIISDRKCKDMDMIGFVEEADKELEQAKWDIIALKYKEKHDKELDVAAARKRFEIVKNGGSPPVDSDSDKEEGSDMDGDNDSDEELDENLDEEDDKDDMVVTKETRVFIKDEDEA